MRELHNQHQLKDSRDEKGRVLPFGQAQEQIAARTLCETGNLEPTGLSLAILVLGTSLDTNSVLDQLATSGCGSELGGIGKTTDELHTGQLVDGRGGKGAEAVGGAR
jgi:hypothetical protein